MNNVITEAPFLIVLLIFSSQVGFVVCPAVGLY